MFMVNTTLKVLFVEMDVNVIFVKLLVQHNEFNSCQRMVLYKYKNSIIKILAAFLHATEQHISLMGTLQETKALAHTTQLGCLTVDRSVGLAGGCCGSVSGTDWRPPCARSSALPASTG